MTSHERETQRLIEEATRVFEASSPARQAELLAFVREVNRLGRLRQDERCANLRAAMGGVRTEGREN